MAEFIYNNSKNASTGHTSFELNCNYHPQMSYKEKVNPRSQSKSADELSKELRELIVIIAKISTMPKNFKSELTIRELSLEATPPARRFD